jgi:hypothetical protein
VVGSLLAVPTIGAIKAVATYLRHHEDPDYRGPGSGLAPPGGKARERLKVLLSRARAGSRPLRRSEGRELESRRPLQKYLFRPPIDGA